MAQKVIVELLDDLDGSPARHTIPFSLDGVSYEIDLSDDNATALRGELARFIAVSRRSGGRKIRITATQPTSTSSAVREQSRAIRFWASKNGYDIFTRGRLPFEIINAYDDAQRQVTDSNVAENGLAEGRSIRDAVAGTPAT
ncbi:Lsr2 family protein [Amycolatopsis sp. NPDC088138]|uniref:histone-like nucleoid-structuring protein Lsr2 n=1 Tax=Amycolatopsis sp. NPDC088138 TaxID=3363938 RepID=UPI003802F0A2